MRILHIDTGPEMKGGQYQVMLLLGALQSSGHECILLAREGGALWAEAARNAIHVLAADAKQVWRHSKDVAIVHAHDARAHTIAAIASRRRFVVSRRVAFPIKRSVASHWKYQRAARFLAVSNFVAHQLEAVGLRKEKIDVVYDAVEPVESVRYWSANTPAVALATRDRQKGRDLIEEAAARSGIHVLFSDDLTRDLPGASMFIYITRSEGLGSAALLAMNLGVPVVASSIGGLCEVFEDGTSGIFVRNEAADIAAAMQRVLSDSLATRARIAAARDRIRTRFTKEQLTAGTMTAYEKALGG